MRRYHGNELCKQLLAQFPESSTHAIARMAYKKSPALFSSRDAAVQCVRFCRGAKGKHFRKFATMPKTPFTGGGPAFKIPEPKAHFDGWAAVQFDGPLRALILSDVHLPYHDAKALGAVLKHGREFKANMVLLNGDLMDFHAVSSFEKDPREKDFKGELQMGREFLAELRRCFPRAKLVFKIGNHEERYERYMFAKAPELVGIQEFTVEKLLQCEESGVRVIGEKRPIRLGRLNVIHGHEYTFNISNPVNPARGFFLKAKTHCLGGHLHQTSHHPERDLEGRTISCWSTGALCNLHPAYRPMNAWNHGFATVEVERDGSFEVKNHMVINGKVR